MSAYAEPGKLYFFLDYLSHNAYLAWHEAPALARKHGLELRPVPVVFGAMLSHYGQVGPAEVPAKSRWMLWNVLRKARQKGIPIAPPASHPFNPLPALRATCAAPAGDQVRIVDRLFRAAWAESRDLSDAATVRELLVELGLSGDELLAAAATDAVKQRLRENTEAAIAAGVFGVPTVIARGELFWGFDDLPYLDMFLSGKDPLPADRGEFRAWLDVKPSVQRRRP